MAKRKPGQERGKRRGPEFLDQAGAARGHACSHPDCTQVRLAATRLIFAGGRQSGLNTYQLRQATAHLPKLLCVAGAWPPPNMPAKTLNYLAICFALACLETGVDGMIGQKADWYAEIVEKVAHMEQDANT